MSKDKSDLIRKATTKLAFIITKETVKFIEETVHNKEIIFNVIVSSHISSLLAFIKITMASKKCTESEFKKLELSMAKFIEGVKILGETESEFK